MLALLLAGGGVYLALGDLQEALILLAFAMISHVITVVQEARTEHFPDNAKGRTLARTRKLVIALAPQPGLRLAFAQAAIRVNR
jgi:P-type Ca2+ transporter type 2C